MLDKQHNTNAILKIATKLGFAATGIVSSDIVPKKMQEGYKDWLSAGYHGEMGYMQKHVSKRINPNELFPGARSIVVVLVPYYAKRPSLKSGFKIARYACGVDYHFVLKQRLIKLLEAMQEIDNRIEGRPFVDSAPVLERYWAQKAGLGFIGKNGMLIHPDLGSYTFIGALVTNAIFEPSQPKQMEGCGDCQRCIKACPDSAITSMSIVDSRLCISYKTIEYKGDFKPGENLRNYIFGCDICQEVCPYNQNLKTEPWTEFMPDRDLVNLSRQEIAQIGSSRFKRLFAKSVVFRTGARCLRRNALAIETFNSNNDYINL